MENLSLAIGDADRIDDLPRAFTYRRQRALEATAAAEPRPDSLLDIGAGRLALFFLKCVVAAIPALCLLTVLLWAAGEGLQYFFPELLKMKILIYAPEASQ
jgi:hypothetical protein